MENQDIIIPSLKTCKSWSNICRGRWTLGWRGWRGGGARVGAGWTGGRTCSTADRHSTQHTARQNTSGSGGWAGPARKGARVMGSAGQEPLRRPRSRNLLYGFYRPSTASAVQ